MAKAENALLRSWRQLARWPGGRWLFIRLLGYRVPYSGTIKANIIELEAGRVTLSLPDRRRVRNHLNSIHAIALVNAGELASGLAMLSALPDHIRGIVTAIHVDYKKKARGCLQIRGEANPPHQLSEDTELPVTATLIDADGDVVAEVVVTWRLRQFDEPS